MRIRALVFGTLIGMVAFALLAVTAWGAEGDLLWQVQIDKFGGNDNINGAAAADNRVFIAGDTRDPSRPHPVPGVIGNSDFFVQAYSASTGALLWEDIVVTAGSDDGASAVVADGERVFVGGDSSSGGGNFDFLIRAYDATTGTILWQDKVATGSEFGLVRKLALQSGRLFAISANGLVRVYEAITGTLVWADKINNESSFGFVGRDLAVDKKRVFAVGRLDNFGTGNPDFLVRAYDADTGDVLWESRVDQGADDNAVAVASQSEKVFVAGATNRDFLVRGYQAGKGFLQWENRIGQNSLANAIVADDNRVFVGGLIDEAPHTLILRAYKAANGAPLWENQIEDGFSDSNYLAAIKGRLFAVGLIETGNGPTDFRYFVRAYDSKTGTLHWSNQENGFLHALAVDDQERFFAAGFVVNALGNADGLLRAYDARP